MPESYTHLRIARAALVLADAKAAASAAFLMGANGPDPLFADRVLHQNKTQPLAPIGKRIHNEKCGAFLTELLSQSKTTVQRDYARGFLTHYAADTIFHPYVASQSGAGAAFDKPAGHGFCEAALDTYFCAMDTGHGGVSVDEAAPKLSAPELAEIVALLRRSIAAVYGETLSVTNLCNAFHSFRAAHWFFYSPAGGKRILAAFAENIIFHKQGYLRCHMTPAPMPRKGFAAEWTNPYTAVRTDVGPNGLTMQAVRQSANFLRVAQCFWAGNASEQSVLKYLGNKSYTTGLPLENDAEL
ncbi:MAG: zinc dependent phospholipase C family protein [Ruthenibacterium sp.]